jgi:hypothetical protein
MVRHYLFHYVKRHDVNHETATGQKEWRTTLWLQTQQRKYSDCILSHMDYPTVSVFKRR